MKREYETMASFTCVQNTNLSRYFVMWLVALSTVVMMEGRWCAEAVYFDEVSASHGVRAYDGCETIPTTPTKATSDIDVCCGKRCTLSYFVRGNYSLLWNRADFSRAAVRQAACGALGRDCRSACTDATATRVVASPLSCACARPRVQQTQLEVSCARACEQAVARCDADLSKLNGGEDEAVCPRQTLLVVDWTADSPGECRPPCSNQATDDNICAS